MNSGALTCQLLLYTAQSTGSDSAKSLIIIPGAVSDYNLELRRRYKTDAEVRRLADDIHEHRMLPPPTCDECIELAIAELSQSQQ